LRDPRSILVIKPSSLGDVVHTLPAVARIRRHWPRARITWLVNPEWAPLLAGNRDIDDVINFPRSEFRGLRGWLRLPGWSRRLRQRVQPDLVLDFQGLLRSAVVARGVGGESYGTSDSRECARFLHRHVVPVPARSAPVHAVERYLALAKALGCDEEGPLSWPLPEGSEPAGVPPRFVLLHPFSRGAEKSLVPPEVTAFCAALAPCPVVIAGRSAEAIPPLSGTVNLLNQTTLHELCWLIRRAAFVVSVDSGPMHIAAALNPALLAIHTWSDPRKVGPFRPEAFVWKDGTIGRMADFPGGENCPRAGLGRWVAARLRQARDPAGEN
jgi:ADP-heptose:LPS heptosyltransferase